MNTRLTVAIARVSLERFASSASLFIPELNQVIERLNNYGIWKDACNNTVFQSVPSGIITLPRRSQSVVGATVYGIPTLTFSQFHAYQELGYAWLDPLQTGSYGLIDMGDDYCTQADFATGTSGTLKAVISSATDAAKVIRLYGRDASGNQIYDTTGVEGITLTTANPSASTTQVFSSLTGMQIAATFVGSWRLYSTIAGVDTQLGYYEPGETSPVYRRYKVGVLSGENTVRCLCKRRFIPVVAESDWVHPGSIGALKLGLQALNQETLDGMDKSDGLWARAIKTLDEELKNVRGSIKVNFPYTDRIGLGGPVTVH